MSQRVHLYRAAIIAALGLLIPGCAGSQSSDVPEYADVDGYQEDRHGTRVAAYVYRGPNDRGCAQYSLHSLRDDVHVPTRIFFWDGDRFTSERDRCVPGVTPPADHGQRSSRLP